MKILLSYLTLFASVTLGVAQNQIEVEGNVNSTVDLIKSTVNYSGNHDVIAIEGSSVTNPGFGIGGKFLVGIEVSR